MSDLYTPTSDGVVQSYRRVHANGEQTHVAILSVGERDYAAVAYDVGPAGFEPIAAECIGYDPTIEGVTERAERWMDANPKGVAYEDGGGGDDGRDVTGTIHKMFKKLNEYGNRQREQMQQNQGGQH